MSPVLPFINGQDPKSDAYQGHRGGTGMLNLDSVGQAPAPTTTVSIE